MEKFAKECTRPYLVTPDGRKFKKMSEEAVRLGAVKMTCYVVVRYVPKRTGKGHLVWCKDREVTALPLTSEEAERQFPGIELRSFHNQKLTPSECVRAIALSPELFGEGCAEEPQEESGGEELDLDELDTIMEL